MVLIIGGAYQGKLDYAMKAYPGSTVFHCGEGADLDVSAASADIINGLHKLILAQIRTGSDPVKYIGENVKALKDKIIICDDICCGVVPVSAEERLWREAVGRSMSLLSENAKPVIRVFCGLPLYLK